MKFKYNDGGRAAAGFKGTMSDCVTRSISIVTGIPYLEVFNSLNDLASSERTGKRKRKKSNARTGVYRQTYNKYLKQLGYKWVATMQIGTGCKVHLKKDELPSGRLIVRVTKHLTAVIDGVIYDNHDCSREGTRCVYGYYFKNTSPHKTLKN